MREYNTTYNREAGGDDVIGSATPGPIRDLINSGSWNTLAELGESIIDLQLSLHAESLKEGDRRTAQLSLLEQAANQIVDSLTGSDEDVTAISAIPAQLARKVIWDSSALPYPAFRTLRTLLSSSASNEATDASEELPPHSDGFAQRDVDEWILANERMLRDDRRNDWRRGLVDYELHGDSVFPSRSPLPSPPNKSTSASPARLIHRTSLPGYFILDELRASDISIQPSFSAFQEVFTKITGGILNGLDWSNVFVAGGIVLSTLLCTNPTPADLDKYASSDIDVYIHGLDPLAANKKVEHIFDVWKSNVSASEKMLVVRNSRTITFFAGYPTKRVQIVLKLVKNPKEVLLNFDLDICAMGYDGTSLVMLPRAARALETGYNVFTMDLVQGHYLGERRASQDSRVFKYADKGYGIRFLPSYVDSLKDSFASGSGIANELVRMEGGESSYAPDLQRISYRAARWLHRLMLNCSGRGWMPDPPQKNAKGLLEFNHGMLDERSMITSDPGERGCLTSYELLMRHVELWREKVRGHIAISDDVWASNNYDLGPTGYDDSPLYKWGEDFELGGFKISLMVYNDKDYQGFLDTYNSMHRHEGEGPDEDSFHGDKLNLEELGKSRRVCFAPDVSSLLKPEGDVILLFFASPGFADFANELVKKVLEEHGLPLPPNGKMIEVLGRWTTQRGYEGEEQMEMEGLKWRVDAVLCWQQIDRRIDE
ncbi:hypothetical protein DL93DRAFT_577034 [Clavulina sp. PMI_390]|nr:hypothetical protein DL93DRAFT_577034 [Clavulina sp. PMI_390]